MATEGIRLDDGGARKDWPLLVPRAILSAYQPVVGTTATLLWLNLYAMASGDPAGDAGPPAMPVEPASFPSSGPRSETAQGFDGARLVDRLSRLMSVSAAEVERAAQKLESAGLLVRSPAGWLLRWPEGAPPAPATSAAPGGAAEGPEPLARRSADVEDALKAVVAFYHQRIGLMGPSQFQRLRFWIEEQGMSADVVALAIEETVRSARTPRLNYLEGVLRNWYNEGIRTLEDLQRSQRARALKSTANAEGSPNAAAYNPVDPDAVRRWKEMFADEYDG
ncbi:MAG: DnaD domain protein [Firmicutes bacterium]|nr:DnaD domain protein [Bacillota bacterium]